MTSKTSVASMTSTASFHFILKLKCIFLMVCYFLLLSNELIGPKILAKIKIYILTKAELLCPLCYEIPCTLHVTFKYS